VGTTTSPHPPLPTRRFCCFTHSRFTTGVPGWAEESLAWPQRPVQAPLVTFWWR